MSAWRGFLDRIFDRFKTAVPQPMNETAPGPAEVSASPDVPSAAPEQPMPNLDHMVWMLDGMLEQAGFGRQQPRAEPVDVCALLAEIIARHDPARLDVAPAPWPLFVLAKPPALECLFEILLTRALACSPRATVRLDRGTCAMVAHVDDNGLGIPCAERELLLAASVSTPGERGKLATALMLARTLQGEIVVSSSPEGGGRVTVRLPLLPDEALEFVAAS